MPGIRPLRVSVSKRGALVVDAEAVGARSSRLIAAEPVGRCQLREVALRDESRYCCGRPALCGLVSWSCGVTLAQVRG
jgi:hypothetical protein